MLHMSEQSFWFCAGCVLCVTRAWGNTGWACSDKTKSFSQNTQQQTSSTHACILSPLYYYRCVYSCSGGLLKLYPLPRPLEGQRGGLREKRDWALHFCILYSVIVLLLFKLLKCPWARHYLVFWVSTTCILMQRLNDSSDQWLIWRQQHIHFYR